MSLTLGNLNNNIFSPANATVSGVELEQVSKEILSAAPVSKPVALTQELPTVNLNFPRTEADVKIFGTEANSSVEVIKLIASNKASFNVNLSENAINAIDSLKAQAAKLQALDLTNRVNGKIHVPAETPSFTESKSIFALTNAPQLFEAGELSKDRKGPNPFFANTARNNKRK